MSTVKSKWVAAVRLEVGGQYMEWDSAGGPMEIETRGEPRQGDVLAALHERLVEEYPQMRGSRMTRSSLRRVG